MPGEDPVIIESSVWIDLLDNTLTPQVIWLQGNLPSRAVSLVDLTLCEVLRGIECDKLRRETLQRLLGFEVLNTGGSELAIEAATHYQALRKRGITIRSTIDCLVATFCIREGYSLLHSNRDFDPFESHLGLKVIHPSPITIH